MGNVVGTVHWDEETIPGAVERLESLREKYGLDVADPNMADYDMDCPNAYAVEIGGSRLLWGRERAALSVKSFLWDAADVLDELGSTTRRTHFQDLPL